MQSLAGQVSQSMDEVEGGVHTKVPSRQSREPAMHGSCELWDQGRYRHICVKCEGDYPAVACKAPRLQEKLSDARRRT